ncbi:MAG: peptide chain release factor N(5)-glutamine methyltransferase [Bacteroidetes bacterium HGW-Bacteroidetes-1]|jgi:release factor glutamine methyltransferase|nr:MAG: peptide chain release factor N(5)-glutamine methyltransferase [Bacteroidetes bacterium HGW-Bacteroidetes-1]
MKVPTNKVKDIISYYKDQLLPLYGEEQSRQMLGMLIENFFGFDRIYLVLNPEERLSESEMLTIHFAVKELLKHRPIQYVIGKALFCGHWFEVNQNVLIPRPETEEMVEMAIAMLKNDEQVSVLDIGTGSGCIAISIELQHPKVQVDAIDVSKEALEVAELNAKRLNSAVQLIQMDIKSNDFSCINKQYDLIISNPPYVSKSEMQLMRSNVLDWEPSLALFVPDDDPLLFYRYITDFAHSHLKSGGILLFEINEKFGQEVLELLEAKKFSEAVLLYDYHGKYRFVKGLM